MTEAALKEIEDRFMRCVRHPESWLNYADDAEADLGKVFAEVRRLGEENVTLKHWVGLLVRDGGRKDSGVVTVIDYRSVPTVVGVLVLPGRMVDAYAVDVPPPPSAKGEE